MTHQNTPHTLTKSHRVPPRPTASGTHSKRVSPESPSLRGDSLVQRPTAVVADHVPGTQSGTRSTGDPR